jgi:hypothetical protein
LFFGLFSLGPALPTLATCLPTPDGFIRVVS